MKLRPWSDKIAFGAPNRQIRLLIIASAVLKTVMSRSGTASEYLVSRSCMVRIYVFPCAVVGRGPTMSIETLSNALPGVSVRIMGCLVFTLVSFFNWQLSHVVT